MSIARYNSAKLCGSSNGADPNIERWQSLVGRSGNVQTCDLLLSGILSRVVYGRDRLPSDSSAWYDQRMPAMSGCEAQARSAEISSSYLCS